MDVRTFAFGGLVISLFFYAGYRAQLNGWLKLVGWPMRLLRNICTLVLGSIVLMWCAQIPLCAPILEVGRFLIFVWLPFQLGTGVESQ